MEPRNNRGYGQDSDPRKRPAIPRERVGRFLSRRKSSQSGQRRQRKPATPQGAQPPRGLSGWMRNFAWRYPSDQKRHGVMLMLAQRLDRMAQRIGTTRGAATLATLCVASGATAAHFESRGRGPVYV